MGNSSSTPSSSTTTNTNTNGEQYDVFISFRGEDTRNGFTSHLYQALHEKQIKTFIDNQLKRGEEISDGLWSAIGESKISVIIFSENYASSKWCLRELAEIMKYREMKEQIVIPVFYKVDPSHVGKQIGSYEAAFAKHENELQQDVVKKWRDALTKASKISGFHSSNARDESELVCEIVREVRNKLNHISPSCDFKELVKYYVGIEKHIVGVVSKLCLAVQDFRIIGIWGMGGMGKTTIADVVFHIISHQFENRTYFTSSVRAESEKDNTRLIRLRNEILSKVLNIENQISSSPNIPRDLKKMLLQKKVLIVFDDVDSIGQLETLAGDLDRLGSGSRIIVTTRDKQVLRNCGVKDHNMYEVKGLNDDEVRQLFCNHAFKQNHPTEDFKDLSSEMVKIATDVPLAVKLLGLLLYTRSKQYWEDAVDQFKGIMNPTIFDRLKISYNGLREEEKGLFLDIACFVDVFAFGRDVPKLLSNRMCFLAHLIDKSLVTVECGYIKMHDLLREMGMKIASENRSRLWRQEDVLRTLEHNDGTDAVQGIFLNMFMNSKDVCQALMKMNNLTTLIITGGLGYHYYGGLDYLPNKLRYLHWKRYPLEVLPSSVNPENLVELNLSCSKIKQLWKGSTLVPKLKWLNLDYCVNLISIPDLSNIQSAEIINLKFCSSLIEIHSSRKCPKLKWLNLDRCENLISIPDLSNIPSAEIINLQYCSSLIEIHSSTECPKNLHSLQLRGCKSLSSFPKNIHLSEEPSFSTSVVLHSSMEGSEFSLFCCFSLTQFPDISGNIKKLDLSRSGVEEVPSTIESLSKLECLYMVECRSLKRISKSICKLKSLILLDLTGCCKLEKLPPLSGLCSLKQLRLINSNLTEISEDIGCLSSLEELELNENVFERLPKSIKQLSKLYYLSLTHCGMLQSLPEIPSSLRYLGAMHCKKLFQSLPDESEFEFCPDGSGSFYFNFLNCLKLNQKAVNNLLIFFRHSLQKMQGMVTEKIISLSKVSLEVTSQLHPSDRCLLHTPGEEVKGVQGSICFPGSKIPNWFWNNNIGSSIKVLRNDCARSRYIMGFEVCLVIGAEGYRDDMGYRDNMASSIDVYYDCHIETSDGHKEGLFRNSIQLFDAPVWGSDHILLWYNLSRKYYEFFQELDTRLANRGMSDYVGISFEFNIRSKDIFRNYIRNHRHFLNYNRNRRYEVKYCGIKPIYIKK